MRFLFGQFLLVFFIFPFFFGTGTYDISWRITSPTPRNISIIKCLAQHHDYFFHFLFILFVPDKLEEYQALSMKNKKVYRIEKINYDFFTYKKSYNVNLQNMGINDTNCRAGNKCIFVTNFYVEFPLCNADC